LIGRITACVGISEVFVEDRRIRKVKSCSPLSGLEEVGVFAKTWGLGEG